MCKQICYPYNRINPLCSCTLSEVLIEIKVYFNKKPLVDPINPLGIQSFHGHSLNENSRDVQCCELRVLSFRSSPFQHWVLYQYMTYRSFYTREDSSSFPIKVCLETSELNYKKKRYLMIIWGSAINSINLHYLTTCGRSYFWMGSSFSWLIVEKVF